MGKVPQVGLNDLPVEQVQSMITDIRQLYDLPKPKSNEELKQRIDDYFMYCQNSSLRPGMESLCLCLHCGRTTFYEWSKGIGCDREKQEICERARAFIHTYLEQASICGKLNPATGIFLMKNWLGYRDTLSLEDATDRQAKIPPKTLEEIASEFSKVDNAELPPPIDLDD